MMIIVIIIIIIENKESRVKGSPKGESGNPDKELVAAGARESEGQPWFRLRHLRLSRALFFD